MTRLCPPCADLHMRWLDYRPARTITLASIGDSNIANVRAKQQARADDTYQLIREQQAAIREDCAAGRHAKPRPPDAG